MAKLSTIPAVAALLDYDGRRVSQVLAAIESGMASGKNFPIVELTGVSGTANGITTDAPPYWIGYVPKQTFRLFPNSFNTVASPTIDIGGTGPITLQTNRGGIVAVNDIIAGAPIDVRISGTAGNFVGRIIQDLPSQRNASPALTGTPTAPTVSDYSDISDRIATMKAVQRLRTMKVVSVAGTANAVTGSLPSALAYTAYASGDRFTFAWPTSNTGAASVNINSIGAIPIRVVDGLTDPAANTLIGGALYSFEVTTVSGSPVLRIVGGETLSVPDRPAGEATSKTANTKFVTTAVNGVKGEVAAASLFANSIPAGIADYSNAGAWGVQTPATTSVAAVVQNGYDKWQVTEAVGNTGFALIDMPLADIDGYETDVLSFSCLFSASAGNGTTGSTRVMVDCRQGSTQLSRQSQSFNTTGAAVTDTTVSFPGFAIPAGTDNIRIWVDAKPGNGTVARTAYVSQLLIAGGTSSIFRGRSTTGSGSSPQLLTYAILPGLPGGAPTGGFTCTGLDRITTGAYAGFWLMGSDGRGVEGDGSDFAARVALISPDFRTLISYFDLADHAADGVQGVAFDSSDGTVWVARPGLSRIEHYDMTGAEIAADRIVLTGWAGAWTQPNGLAYDPVNNALIVGASSSATAYRIPKSATISATLTLGTSSPDHFSYDATNGVLYASSGANGANGSIYAHDMAAGTNKTAWSNLKLCQAIEGIFVDVASGLLFVVNDGGFHAIAKPPLNIGLTFII